MIETLEARFKRFMASLSHAEAIDDLQLAKQRQDKERADYFLGGRIVTVELKSLTSDPSDKAHRELAKHESRPEYPVFYGERELGKILAALPDGEAVHRRIYTVVTRQIENAVRKSETQIADTRELFQLPNSAGMLVILNESIDILDPHVVASRISQLLLRPRTGNVAADKLDCVWLIFESHSVHGAAKPLAFPSCFITGEGADKFDWLADFHADLRRRWAAFNGVSIIKSDSDISKLTFAPPRSEEVEQRGDQALHQAWRQRYRAAPRLRHLSDDDILAFGSELIATMRPSYIKGGRGFDKQRDLQLMEVFTGFLEEMNHRGLDMRRIPKPVGEAENSG